MNESEKEMSRIMSHKGRQGMLSAVVRKLPRDSSFILDIGCGPSAAYKKLKERFPNGQIIGLDLSSVMLENSRPFSLSEDYSLVQSFIPFFPFTKNSIDACIAIQSLSEIYSFQGKDGLVRTLEKISHILTENGVLVVLDHSSPGSDIVELSLSENALEYLEYFKENFVYRKISYTHLDELIIEISLQDLYEFLTKTWCFDGPLEDEEMNETHTPYTPEEFADIAASVGFDIDTVERLNSMASRLQSHEMTLVQPCSLPDRYLLVKLSKKE